jgi:hypothetical protein
LRVLASAASACALEGCSSLAGTAARFDAAELTANPTLLIATTRKPVNGARGKPWFGPDRAARMSVARAKLAAPDEGRFSLASIGLDDWRIETIEMVPKIGDLLGPAAGMRDVLLYVHGFNQTFETAALDAARLPMVFASTGRRWCSPGRQSRSCSIMVTIAKAPCGRAMPSNRCSRA